MGSLPFNETIKGPVSLSIDFSHSFSDKFELIIQHQVPGDVYFQHEGQLIHSIGFPTLCLSVFFSLLFYIYLLLSVPLLHRSHLMMGPAGRVLTKEGLCHTHTHTSSLNFFCSLWDQPPTHTPPPSTALDSSSASWGFIYSKVIIIAEDGG